MPIALVEQIRKWITGEQAHILDFCRLLVETPTYNTPPTGLEKNGQLLLREALADCGWETDLYLPEEVPGFRQHPAFWLGRDYTDRPNLWASFGSDGGDARQRLLFNGHMDVVPAGYAPAPEGGWDFPARLATRFADGRLYGPGAADMKGGLVAMLAAARCVTALGVEPPGRMMIESVVDEEYGGANGSLAGRLRGPQAALAILAEPTQLTLCPAALCGINYVATLKLPAGDIPGTVPGTDQNPVFWLGEFIHHLRNYAAWRSAHRPVPPLYTGQPRPGLSISWVEAGSPPTAGLDRVPEACRLSFGIEDYPEISQAQLWAELHEHVVHPLRAACPALEIELALGTRFLEGVSGFPEPQALRFVQETIRQVTGASASVAGMAASCDVFIFNHHSPTPALILGPRGGGFHTPGEYVEFASVLELAQIFAALMLTWDPESGLAVSQE